MARLTNKQINAIYEELNSKLEKYNLRAKFYSPLVSPGFGLCRNGEAGITYNRVFDSHRRMYDAICRFYNVLCLIENKHFTQDEIGRLFEITSGSGY